MRQESWATHDEGPEKEEQHLPVPGRHVFSTRSASTPPQPTRLNKLPLKVYVTKMLDRDQREEPVRWNEVGRSTERALRPHKQLGTPR